MQSNRSRRRDTQVQLEKDEGKEENWYTWYDSIWIYFHCKAQKEQFYLLYATAMYRDFEAL